jgi:hypothetical protein
MVSRVDELERGFEELRGEDQAIPDSVGGGIRKRKSGTERSARPIQDADSSKVEI